MFIGLLVFMAGVLQAAMQSFNGVLQGYVGLFGTSLAVHVTGGFLLILYIVLICRERLRLGPMPWYLYSAGFFGLVLVACTSLCIARIGSAFTTCLGISGQLVMSILMDHFGWMGVKQVAFEKKRIPCLIMILCGILIVNFGGQAVTMPGQTGGAAAAVILLAFVIGCINVLSKTINFQATNHLGTMNGTLVNYVVASALSAILLTVAEPEYLNMTAFKTVPAWMYLGGVFGVVALVINVISLKKINLFQSTVLLLVGQLVGATVLDVVLFGNMSAVKLVGVAVVAAGVVWDKKASFQQENSLPR